MPQIFKVEPSHRLGAKGSASTISYVLLIAWITLALGCGHRRPDIEGRITLDGVPITKGAIQFIPANGKGQTAGTGVVDGRYRIPASIGIMRVVINWPQANGKMLDPGGSGQMIDRYIESVPTHYNDETELEFTVQPGRNVADFALEGSLLKSPDASAK